LLSQGYYCLFICPEMRGLRGFWRGEGVDTGKSADQRVNKSANQRWPEKRRVPQRMSIPAECGIEARWNVLSKSDVRIAGFFRPVAEAVDPCELLNECFGLIWSDRVNSARSVGLFL